MDTFGKRLKELREYKGVSRSELAEKIGVNITAIGFWERDVNEPKLSYIKLLAEYFDVTTDFLLGLDESGKNFIPDETITLRGIARGGQQVNIEIKKSALPELQKMLDAAAEQTKKDNEKNK